MREGQSNAGLIQDLLNRKREDARRMKYLLAAREQVAEMGGLLTTSIEALQDDLWSVRVPAGLVMPYIEKDIKETEARLQESVVLLLMIEDVLTKEKEKCASRKKLR